MRSGCQTDGRTLIIFCLVSGGVRVKQKQHFYKQPVFGGFVPVCTPTTRLFGVVAPRTGHCRRSEEGWLCLVRVQAVQGTGANTCFFRRQMCDAFRPVVTTTPSAHRINLNYVHVHTNVCVFRIDLASFARTHTHSHTRL